VLAFYDFPGRALGASENYQSIESTFATVRNRSEITKGAGFARGRNRYGLHADRGRAVMPARGQRPHLVSSSAPEPNSRTANPSNDATNQEVKIKPRNTLIHSLEISLQKPFPPAHLCRTPGRPSCLLVGIVPTGISSPHPFDKGSSRRSQLVEPSQIGAILRLPVSRIPFPSTAAVARGVRRSAG
jgi:hypothetical protein